MAIGKTFKFGKTLVNVSGRGIATKDTSTGEIRRFGFPWANRAGKGEQEAEDGAPSREYARYEDDASDLYENDDRYTRDSYEDTEEDESYDEDEVNAYDEGDAEPEPGRGRSLVDAPWFMWAMLVILPPLGIWLLWRNNRFEITPRSIISGAAVIWFIIMLVWLFSHLGGGGDVPVLPDLPTTSPTVEATATPEPTDVPTATPEITQEAVVTPQAQNTPVPDDLTGTGTTTQAPDNTSTSEGTTPTSVPFVWSTPTGKYYHSYATCSNMTNASKVTLSVALNRKQEACPLCWVPPEVTPKPTNTPLPANMFYSTPNGEYYHLDPACSGMRNAQVISQAEAMSTRGQSACPICIGSVYMTEGGTYFHANSTCSGMKNARLVTVNEAQQAGKLPCRECQPLAANGGANQVFGSATSNSAVGNAVFYMTDGGTYYHSEPNCSGMRNARETSAREAETAGKLPCPVCMNGLSGQVNYYATPNGKYYHTDRNCSGMQNTSTVTVYRLLLGLSFYHDVVYDI